MPVVKVGMMFESKSGIYLVTQRYPNKGYFRCLNMKNMSCDIYSDTYLKYKCNLYIPCEEYQESFGGDMWHVIESNHGLTEKTTVWITDDHEKAFRACEKLSREAQRKYEQAIVVRDVGRCSSDVEDTGMFEDKKEAEEYLKKAPMVYYIEREEDE